MSLLHSVWHCRPHSPFDEEAPHTLPCSSQCTQGHDGARLPARPAHGESAALYSVLLLCSRCCCVLNSWPAACNALSLPLLPPPQMGITDGARYLSSNSGGSWLNAAFGFQQKVRARRCPEDGRSPTSVPRASRPLAACHAFCPDGCVNAPTLSHTGAHHHLPWQLHSSRAADPCEPFVGAARLF
jgi:hypothetical protein